MVGGWTDIYKKAKACGFDLTVIQDRADIRPLDVEIIDQLMTAPRFAPIVVELADTLHQSNPFDAVVSFQETGVMNAALIGERLGLHANPLGPVLLTKDKGRMRAHLASTSIASIPFVVASSADAVIAFAHDIGWPIILKPLDGLGSHHIHRLERADQVEAAFATIKADYPATNPIAEKYMQGPEVSVEAVSWDGVHTILCVTDKLTSGAPHFVETGHNMPSALPAKTIRAIEAMCADFLSSIKHIHGPSHTEMIITSDGPIIVESHTRVGGDRIWEMVELVRGVDMILHTLTGLSGGVPSDADKPASGAAIRFISLPSGRVTAIDGVHEVEQSPGVVRLELPLTVGQDIKTFTHSFERYGYVLATGPTAAAAIEHVNTALSKLNVTVLPE